MRRAKETARQRVARNIRARRIAANWSQEHLAEECGLHRTYIGSVERGERNISIDNVEAIAAAFSVDVSELLEK